MSKRKIEAIVMTTNNIGNVGVALVAAVKRGA